MTAGEQQGLTRCGLDLAHEEHYHPGGWCDGVALEGAAGPTINLATLYAGVTAHPRAWSWATLTSRQAREVRAQLRRFVTFYNQTFVVEDQHLILGCWPLHPGIAHELPVLYAQWVVAFQGSIAPEPALYWFDRWLPGFQSRTPRWFGLGDDRCKPGKHRGDWNPALAKLADAALAPEDGVIDDALDGYVDNPARITDG